MKRIGKYQSKICYELTKEEFFNGKCYDNTIDIFILHEDGLMIYKNIAFGRYDGTSVDEFSAPYEYYVPDKVNRQTTSTSITPGEFSEYSKCVDDFFTNLKEVSL